MDRAAHLPPVRPTHFLVIFVHISLVPGRESYRVEGMLARNFEYFDYYTRFMSQMDLRGAHIRHLQTNWQLRHEGILLLLTLSISLI